MTGSAEGLFAQVASLGGKGDGGVRVSVCSLVLRSVCPAIWEILQMRIEN